MGRGDRRLWAALGLALAAAAACTDAELLCVGSQCVPAVAKSLIDDQVSAAGSFCPPPAALAPFPYKVVFVVDTSASSRETDPDGGRGRALAGALEKLRDNPAVYVALVLFNTRPTAVQRAFTQDFNTVIALAGQAGQSQGETNYLDTLELVANMVREDAKALTPGDRAWTQYDVQWLSDGNPELGPLPLTSHCAQTRPKVAALVEALVALPAELGIGGLTLSTIFLQNPIVSPCIDLVRQDRDTYGIGSDYLKDMARAGGGSYQALDANDLSFDIQVTPVRRSFVLGGFYLVNHSRVVQLDSRLPDSDQDGVADGAEALVGLDPTRPDTGGVGCRDRTVLTVGENVGLCTRLCSRPAAEGGLLASPLGDDDGDGLANCEEVALSLDPNQADSDGDMLVDGLELRFGTGFLDAKTQDLDSDLDGVFDRDEIFAGTDPFTRQSTPDNAYVYQPLAADAAAGPGCMRFRVDNVRLVETQASALGVLGDNRLCAYAVVYTRDEPKTSPTVLAACQTVNYQVHNGASSVTPAGGQITFAAGDFQPVICGRAVRALCARP